MIDWCATHPMMAIPMWGRFWKNIGILVVEMETSALSSETFTFTGGFWLWLIINPLVFEKIFRLTQK